MCKKQHEAMKYLTLELIKQHCRIDDSAEDSLLETYGAVAEQTVMNVCLTDYDKMVEEYGELPEPVKLATLLLVDVAYQQRSPISPTNLYLVPYTFDLLLKPYMKLTRTE